MGPREVKALALAPPRPANVMWYAGRADDGSEPNLDVLDGGVLEDAADAAEASEPALLDTAEWCVGGGRCNAAVDPDVAGFERGGDS